MRFIFTFIVIVSVASVKAQTPFSRNFQTTTYGSTFAPNKNVYDSVAPQKWCVSKYTGITAGYNFSSHGSARFVAAPAVLQLNRRLSNNMYGYAGIAVAPVYFNFYRTFLNTDFNKIKAGNTFYQPGNFAMYSSATLGLMYINNEKTFSVSGSISVERNNYPLQYNSQLNTTKPNNTRIFYR